MRSGPRALLRTLPNMAALISREPCVTVAANEPPTAAQRDVSIGKKTVGRLSHMPV
ncbi:hypothetical protein BCh11DRAFT_04899 [Burkholderia sp. Ch1-1]|nr:hypothetical protein BCh11DRAFT_04899 [Burkholderia sp. Ch1-1]